MNYDVRFPTDRYFYDTCSLLLAGESLFEQDKKPFLVSSITLKELERIKTASNKDADIKYSARLLLHLFEEYPDKYEVIPHKVDNEFVIKEAGFDVTDDTRILSDAIACDKEKDIVFVTNDLSLKHIANCFFGNGMIILKNSNGEIVDLRVWTGEEFRYLSSKTINSKWFGKISPYSGDIYQKMLFDSLRNNKLTLVKGPAGSGKTFVSLAYLMAKMEAHELDKLLSSAILLLLLTLLVSDIIREQKTKSYLTLRLATC